MIVIPKFSRLIIGKYPPPLHEFTQDHIRQLINPAMTHVPEFDAKKGEPVRHSCYKVSAKTRKSQIRNSSLDQWVF